MIQEPSIAPIRISELSKGHACAQYNLGFMYDNRRGVPQDYVQAHMWFNLSASRRTGEDRELIDSVFPLSEVRTAHDNSRSGRAKGKIVLEVVPA